MRHLYSGLLVIACVFFSNISAAQDEVWTLQRSVQFALEHNLTIQQNVLNQRLAQLRLKQSLLSQLPNANANGSYGRSYGRSVDPTTNQFVEGTSSYDFTSASGNLDVLLFGWFQKRNIIAGNRFSLQAASADLEQVKDDISLNVATGYLRSLLAKEQVRVTEKQVELSRAQYDQTKRFAAAGRLPELSVAQLESQLVGDSANLIAAVSDYNNAILDIKALLNLDFTAPFKIQIPDVETSDQVAFAALTPEEIYEEAAKNLGTIRSSQFKVFAAEKNLNAAKGGLWPQLGFTGQFGTNYASTFNEITGVSYGSPQPTNTFVEVNGTSVPVFQRTVIPTTRSVPVYTQFDNNFRQVISLNLTVPIFNAWQGQYSVRQSKVNVLSAQLSKSQAELKLKQDVYKAYNDARNAIQRYNAADRASKAAQRAFDFAEKRYDLGLTNTVEYLTTQNTLYAADSRLASAKYELIFKLKVIDYYLGKELKL